MKTIRSKYIYYLLTKEWFPLIITFLAVSSISFIIYATTVNIYSVNTSFSLLPLTIPITFFAVSMPIFVFNYKNNLQSADMFYQLPFKEKEFKNTRVITGLIAVLFSLVVAFLLGFIIFNIRYYTSPYILETYGVSEVKVIYSPWMLLLSFLVSVVTIGLEYFISCYITSFTSKPIPAVIFNIVVQLFLVTFLSSILLAISDAVDYFTMIKNNYSPHDPAPVNETSLALVQSANLTALYSPSFWGANAIANLLASRHVLNDQGLISPDSFISFSAVFFYLSISLFFVIGALAVFLTLYGKNPSGEYCGTPGLNNAKLNFLIYIAFIPITLYLITLEPILVSAAIIIDVLIIAYYYFLNALFLGTFKMPRYNYAILATLAVIIFIAYLL